MRAGLALLAAGCLLASAQLAGSTPSRTTTAETTPDSIGQRFVPSGFGGGLEGAFNSLSQSADALALSFSGTPSPPGQCKHIEGIARKDGPDGTPYLFMSKSGLVPDSLCDITTDNGPGYLFVARMGSQANDGERMGPTTLPYDRLPWPRLADNKVVTAIPLDGAHGLPAYRHPGGMQILGNVLAVGVENPFNGESPRAIVLFFDISDPEHPTLASRFNPPDEDGAANAEFGADPVGLTAVRADDGTCCRYLLVVAGGPANKDVRFYKSRPDAGSTTTTLTSPNLAWDLAGRYTEADLDACPGMDWPVGSGPFETGQHQMLNFVREGNLDGALYLVGGRRTGAIVNPDADEKVDLYRVNFASSGALATCVLTPVSSKTMGDASWGGFTYTGSFSAGSSVYVSPSGELLVYVSNHGVNGDNFFAGEYRTRSLVRANSPTLRPSAKIDGPFAVDEGSSVALTGEGRAPITKAFVQLFGNTDVGLDGTGGPWMTVEYGTRDADSFDQLDYMAPPANGIWEETSSVRWFAPPGCTISANDYPTRSDDWPGPSTVLLRGTGRFEEVTDLNHLDVYHPAGEVWPATPVPAGVTPISRGFNDDIEGVTFYHDDSPGSTKVRVHDCESYYNAHFTLGWDLNGDGTFESSGDSVDFSASTLDGPSTATVHARGKHPTDTSPVGVGDSIPVEVQVRNVPPQIGSSSVKDSLGHDLSGGSTPVILGLPVTLSLTFTDPGIADTQTGSIDWGDGSALDSSFTAFSDAHGGATGSLVDSHAFTTPGTKTVTVTVTDDDGGATPQQMTVNVLSLADAINAVANQLTQKITTTTNAKVAAALRSARDELIGNHSGTPPTNGATDKLAANDPSGAIVKLKAALGDLIMAESLGAGDLSAMKDLVGLVAEGIATATYQKAQTAIPSPSGGQAKTFTTIKGLIDTGHQQLAAHTYLDACDSFKAATDKALGLLPH